MGLRFRKSVKIAPGVKVNFNKKSTGVTFGGRGAHYTINSKGKKTTSVGIPGTGLSYTTTSGGTQNTQTKTKNNNFSSATHTSGNTETPKKKRKGCSTAIIVVFILGLLSALFSDDSLESITLSADTTSVYDINTSIPVELETSPQDYSYQNIDWNCSGGEVNKNDDSFSFIASESGTYNVYVKIDGVTSNTLHFTIEDKAAIEAEKNAEEEAQKKADEEAQRKAEEEARLKAEQEAEAQKQAEQKTQQATQEEPVQKQEPMVWIPSSGSKYHSKSSCSNMDNPTQVTQSTAEAQGYTPCKKCY